MVTLSPPPLFISPKISTTLTDGVDDGGAISEQNKRRINKKRDEKNGSSGIATNKKKKNRVIALLTFQVCHASPKPPFLW